MFGPVVPGFGPTPSRVVFLGEAPGDDETRDGRPFTGPSGRTLRGMLRQLGFSLDDAYVTNVFTQQPPNNDLTHFTTDNPSPTSRQLGPLTTNPARFLADEHLPRLHALRRELLACDPHVIIALGNTPSWAILGRQGIGAIRGAVHVADILGQRIKVVPTYHPAAILRQWEFRTIAIIDMEKALRESASREVRYDHAELWIRPTLTDLATFNPHMSAAHVCAVDVETKRGQITCVGFAPSPDRAIVVPFWNSGPNPNAWPTHAEERAAWNWVRQHIESDTPKVFQNGLYDIQYFAAMGFRPRACTEDTMLAHHSLFSELQKGLGFLGATYAHFPVWKNMRHVKIEEQLKRDD